MQEAEAKASLHMLINLFRGLYKSIDDDLRQVAAGYGLTPAQQHLLWVLYFNNGSTLTEISDLGQWHVSTVMNMVERMEKMELLYKIVDENDARVKRVFLTARGQELRKRTEEQAANFRIYKMLLEMPADEFSEEVKTLIHLVRRLSGDKFMQYVVNSTNSLKQALPPETGQTNN